MMQASTTPGTFDVDAALTADQSAFEQACHRRATLLLAKGAIAVRDRFATAGIAADQIVLDINSADGCWAAQVVQALDAAGAIVWQTPRPWKTWSGLDASLLVCESIAGHPLTTPFVDAAEVRHPQHLLDTVGRGDRGGVIYRMSIPAMIAAARAVASPAA